MEQAQNAIRVRACQYDRGDWRTARLFSGSKFSVAQQLLPKIRGGIEQDPNGGSRGNNNLRLGTRAAPKRTTPQAAAVGASAIPLRKTAASGGAENLYTH